MRYRVHSVAPGSWTVTAPGGRTWTGLPSQPAGFALAASLAAIDTMLAGTAPRPLALVGASRRALGYGCYRVPAKGRS